ncbi:MAG: serine hydrolase, partial [Ilumatobacteraceae bacterium]|nr:serine hydrolase [Ilumatobacteraceae bacterium]
DINIEGTVDERFIAVREQFERNLVSGDDVGASVAVIHDGELVVDLWGGTITDDDGVEKNWERDTLINVWSTTKTMTALSALVLADRGELDVDAPVATYWPEFAANGKADVLVRHLLSHSAGLSGWQEPLTADDLFDWEKCTSLLAAQAPWWEPGTASGYHALTQGYLVGEVVRRVSGASVGTFFASEIAGPLGADFFIGTPASEDHRVAHVIPPDIGLAGADPLPHDSLVYRTFSNPPLDAAVSQTVPWRRAEIPAAGGHGNARSVATAQSVVSHGGERNGVRILSEAGIERIFREQTYGQDLILPATFKLGIGYGLVCPEVPISPNPRACFWGGWGGSLCVNDLDSRTTFAYVMNRMGEGTTGDMRGGLLLYAAHAAANAN